YRRAQRPRLPTTTARLATGRIAGAACPGVHQLAAAQPAVRKGVDVGVTGLSAQATQQLDRVMANTRFRAQGCQFVDHNTHETKLFSVRCTERETMNHQAAKGSFSPHSER